MADVSAPQVASAGMAWTDIAKIFQTVLDTIGKVAQTYIQLETMDQQINTHATGIASADRNQQAKQIENLSDSLRIENAKEEDRVKAEKVKRDIIADTGNLGLRTNQAAITTIINLDGLEPDANGHYLNGAISSNDLHDALRPEAKFNLDGVNGAATKDIVASMKDQQIKTREAQQRVLAALQKNGSNSANQLISEKGEVSPKSLTEFMSSEETTLRLQNLSDDQVKEVSGSLQRYQSTSDRLVNEYKEFKALGGVANGSKLNDEVKMELSRPQANVGTGLNTYDTSGSRMSGQRNFRDTLAMRSASFTALG